MRKRLSCKTLETLFELVKEQRPALPDPRYLFPEEEELLKARAIRSASLEELIERTEHRGLSRLNRLIQELASYFDIPSQTIYWKPSRPDDEALGSAGFTASDAVGLLIHLQGLGLRVRPHILMKRFLKGFTGRDLLTDAEMEIFYYEKKRQRQIYILRSDHEDRYGSRTEETFKDANGYRFVMTRTNGEPLQLEVRGPQYRAVKQVDKTCNYCGAAYLTNSPNSARAHRQEHTRVRHVIDPTPSLRFAKRLTAHSCPEKVDSTAPLWMHEEVRRRAIQFRRDFRYDFLQWDGGANRPASGDCHGYLFAANDTEHQGVIAGACAFFPEKEGRWCLGWIWIAPKYRRKGVLESRWSSFLEQYGDFTIEHPLSTAMHEFVVKYGTTHQKGQLSTFHKEITSTVSV